MVTASLTCARLFQDWLWRSWKLVSLTVLRSGSSSEIQISKSQWMKLNWKRRRHLFCEWRAFLATIMPQTTQNLSTTCWLLSETWAATWVSRCTNHFHTWTGFLRTWSICDEHGVRFHQELKEVETRYHDCWDAVMMADYYEYLKIDLPAAEYSKSSKKRKFKPWSLNNGEATCNIRVLTFINTHHSVYSNQCFYQVINICCLRNIFSLKNIFRIICVDKNQLIMQQKCNQFCQKIWFFFKSTLQKNLTWWRETDAISWFSSAKIP